MEIIILNGRRMITPQAAHEYLARTLRFPAYYGANLDALADCLSELGGQVWVLLINAADLRAQLGEYADKLLAVFAQVSGGDKAFKWMGAEE